MTQKEGRRLARRPSGFDRALLPPPEPHLQEAGPRLAVRRVAEGLVPSRPVERTGAFETQVIGGIPVVEILGDVDLENVGRFTAALENAATSARGALILSLGAATYFDSQGIQTLLQVGSRLATNRCALLLVVPQTSPLRHVLDVMDIGTMFPVFESLERALTAAAGSGAPL